MRCRSDMPRRYVSKATAGRASVSRWRSSTWKAAALPSPSTPRATSTRVSYVRQSLRRDQRQMHRPRWLSPRRGRATTSASTSGVRPDYPFGHYGIVFNNTNPDMQSTKHPSRRQHDRWNEVRRHLRHRAGTYDHRQPFTRLNLNGCNDATRPRMHVRSRAARPAAGRHLPRSQRRNARIVARQHNHGQHRQRPRNAEAMHCRAPGGRSRDSRTIAKEYIAGTRQLNP